MTIILILLSIASPPLKLPFYGWFLSIAYDIYQFYTARQLQQTAYDSACFASEILERMDGQHGSSVHEHDDESHPN